MNKKQVIWRELLHQALEKKRIKWTQKELAQKYKVSLSTVFNALKALRKSNIVQVGGRGFKVRDVEKFLYLWATLRNPKKDIIFQTNISQPASKIEENMIPGIIFAAFSAYHKRYQEVPADYDKVYIYASPKQLGQIKKRFPLKEGYPNLIVLEADPWLKNFGNLTPDCQTFVDLWNLPEWYAKDFVEALKQKILR